MIKQDVYDEVQGLVPLCQEICHTLWNHPELSGNERESANFLRKILSEEGFTIEKKQILKKKWYPKMVSDTDVDTIC